MINRSGVYKITCTANGRFYIGSAVNFKRRWIYHRRDAVAGKHSSRHLQRAWDKHGPEAFKFEVLIVCSKECLIMYEQQAMNALKPEFNMAPTAGSCLGVKHTATAREDNASRCRKRWSDPAERAAQSVRTKKAMGDPQIKNKIFAAWREKQSVITSAERRARYTPAVREKMSKASKNHIQATMKKVSISLRQRARKYVVLGESLCMVEITEKYGVSKCLFRSRVLNGWDEETAASKPPRKNVVYESDGMMYSAKVLAEIAGCTPSAFRKRIARGLVAKKAVEMVGVI